MKTREEEWFIEDQAQWHEDQKRDEEELQQLREQDIRDEIRDEVVEEFTRDYWPHIMEKLQDEAIAHGRFTYRLGFFHGFAAALAGAVLFYLLT